MKLLLHTLQALVLTLALVTFVGVYTQHIVVIEVKTPRVVNVVDENQKVLFPWFTGNDVSYRVAIVK